MLCTRNQRQRQICLLLHHRKQGEGLSIAPSFLVGKLTYWGCDAWSFRNTLDHTTPRLYLRENEVDLESPGIPEGPSAQALTQGELSS